GEGRPITSAARAAGKASRAAAQLRTATDVRPNRRSPTREQFLRRVEIVLADEHLRRARDGEPSALGADRSSDVCLPIEAGDLVRAQEPAQSLRLQLVADDRQLHCAHPSSLDLVPRAEAHPYSSSPIS